MFSRFALARYRFVLEAVTPLRLSAFAGATLRGGFGHVFKRTVCLWPPGDCPRCLLKNTCAYPYIFETAPPPGSEKLRNLEQIPRPFVIEPPTTGRGLYRPGERFDFGLVLVGRSLAYLPYFLFTFRELGRAGLGVDRGNFELAEVHTDGLENPQSIYTAAEGVLKEAEAAVTVSALAAQRFAGAPRRQLAVHFQTPARIRQAGAVQSQVSFQDLIRALLRRLSSLSYFHCGSELALDFKGLIAGAGAWETVESNLRWQGQARFSGRQLQEIDMSGVAGTVVYRGPDGESLDPYLPLLAAGEWVHVGKGAVMGLGKYRVEWIR
jgi:hypothetical protein